MLSRLLPLLLLSPLSLSLTLPATPLDCTKSLHQLTDRIYSVITSSFENEYVPEKQTFYDLLDAAQNSLFECRHKNVDLDQYKPCVDRIHPLLEQIEDLAYAVGDRDYREIMKDVVVIGLGLINGVTYCMDI